MRAASFRSPLTLALAATLALGLGAAWAQQPTPAPTTAPETPAPAAGSPKEKRIEHLHTEDAGSRIDEVRYGGETQSITVDTKSGLPPYEIVPANGARNRPVGERDAVPGNTGQRVWNIKSF